ncbi:C40 family peptidase [Streptomyces jietaisiensis]|uniref:C40 family peptidase n=1 Tax=Streptomyces griseoaurantiacus TaxID=68213 RepID=UPI003255EDDF
MNKTVTALALLACGPLLLVSPVLFVSSGLAVASCRSDTATVDAGAVAAQVADVLADADGAGVAVPGLDAPAKQVPPAKAIVATGIAMRIPARGQVVALATALQESGLRNLAYGDRDSLGLFQQRVSQGWGTAEQILDPVHASTRFYEALRNVAGWESLTVAQAAQAVQRSGHPEAYTAWEPLATALQRALQRTLGSGEGSAEAPLAVACTEDGSSFGAIPAGAVPDGYKIPARAPAAVRTAIRWAMGQLGTAYQWGGSCTDAHGSDPMGRCDCSSLMQQSYRAAGVSLGRTTYTQVKEGKPVSVSALEPGDLLFTEGTFAAPEHVGMYIGKGLVIHAPHTGDVVRISTFASWKDDVLAARRIV